MVKNKWAPGWVLAFFGLGLLLWGISGCGKEASATVDATQSGQQSPTSQPTAVPVAEAVIPTPTPSPLPKKTYRYNPQESGMWKADLFRSFRRSMNEDQVLETHGPDTVTLNLPKVIEMALKNNFDIQITRMDPMVQEKEIRAAWAEFYPRLEMSAGYSETVTPQNARDLASTGGTPADVAGGEPRLYSDRRWDPEAALKGKIPFGLEYSLEYRQAEVSDTTNKTSVLSLFTPEYNSFAGVKIKQPLLKGFGFDSHLRQVRVSRVNEQIALSDFENLLNTNLLDVLENYYEFLSAWQEWKLREKAVELTDKLRQQQNDQVERGLMSPAEVDRLELELIENRQDAFNARSAVTSSKLNLLRLIVASFDAEYPTRFEPTDILDESTPQYETRLILREALLKRPDYKKAYQLVEKENIELKYFKNQSLPAIDLETSYGVNGLDKGWSSAASRALGREQGDEWRVGLSVSIPLGPDPNLHKLEGSKIKKEQALMNIKKVETSIHLEISLALEQLKVSRERLASAARMSTSAQVVMNDLEDQLERGTASMVDVVKAYVALVDARAEEIRSIKEVRKAEARLWFASGSISDQANIVVDGAVARK